MNKDALLANLQQSTERLLRELSLFTPENFNSKPSEEEWSAANVAEHLLKIEIFANKALRSETAAADREPDKMISYLKDRMEDNNKRKASEITSPTGEHKDLDEMIAQFQTQRKSLAEAIETMDMTEACIGMPHPVVGVMTRMEWVAFVIYHTDRHLRQLRRLAEAVSA